MGICSNCSDQDEVGNALQVMIGRGERWLNEFARSASSQYIPQTLHTTGIAHTVVL